jgi:hypothetical protein
MKNNVIIQSQELLEKFRKLDSHFKNGRGGFPMNIADSIEQVQGWIDNPASLEGARAGWQEWALCLALANGCGASDYTAEEQQEFAAIRFREVIVPAYEHAEMLAKQNRDTQGRWL